MSYTKQTWQAGDEITSAKLNHLEDGINNVATEVANFPVEVNNPQDGDTLIYNAAEQKWVSGSSNGGSGGGFLKIGVNFETGEFDKTWKEINDAVADGVLPLIMIDDGSMVKVIPILIAKDEEEFGFAVYALSLDHESSTFEVLKFVATSENGYPVPKE